MTDLIERLYEPCRRWKRCKDTRYEAVDEIKRLRELIENDAKEIGSYREGTGLRGEWKKQQAEIERLRDALERIERVVLGTPDQFKQIATEALEDE